MRTAAALILLAASAAGAADDMALGLKLKRAGTLPGAEAAFARAVAAHPKDVDALSQLATVQGWLGRYDRSAATWERALRLAPGCVECRTGLARVLFWKGSHAKALAQVDLALSRNNDDADALILRGDIEAAMGRFEDARRAYTRAKALAPDNQDLDKKLANAVAPPLWRVDAGLVSDHYSRIRGVESDAWAQVGRSFGPPGGAWFRYDYQDQFSLLDRTYQLGGAWRPAKPLLLLADYAVTPRNQVRSRYQFDFGGELSALPYATPLFNYRRMNYATGAIDVYTPGLRLQFVPWLANEFRYSVSHTLGNVKTYGSQFGANFFIGEVLAPYLSYAHGTEAIPPQAAAISDYFSAGAVWNIAPRWSLRVDYAYEDRKAFYVRNSLGSGLGFKF